MTSPKQPSPASTSLSALLPVALLSVSVVLMLWAKLGLMLLPLLLLVTVGTVLSRMIRFALEKLPAYEHNTPPAALLKWATLVLTGGVLLMLGYALTTVGTILVEQVIAQAPLMAAELNKVLSTASWAKSLNLPTLDSNSVQATVKEHLKGHMGSVLTFTGLGLKSIFLLVLSLIAGFSVLSQILSYKKSAIEQAPLVQALKHQAVLFQDCFSNFMTAQAYVALWNTFCTSVFIFGVLPALDVDLPFKVLLVSMTFLFSFIPALGNIVCNSLMAVVCAANGPFIAVLAVVYLIVAHKAEYLINAHFLGRLQSVSVAEILLGLVVGETLFGLFGLVLIPIVYLYLLQALKEQHWV